MPTLRLARSEDANELARMRLALEDHMRASNQRLLPMTPEAVENLEGRYQAWLDNPARRIVVAEDDSGSLVGMAMGSVNVRDDLDPPRGGRIDDVWVEPQYRRQRLATQLVSRLLAFFEDQSVATLVLDYSAGNLEAASTWAALGFEPLSTLVATTPAELRESLEQKRG